METNDLIDEKIMVVNNFGNISIDQINRITRDVIVKVKESRLYKILIDHTEMSFVNSIVNIYEFVKEMNGSLKRASKIAVLISENKANRDDYVFYENACTNNGFFVRVFTRKEDALYWLASFA